MEGISQSSNNNESELDSFRKEWLAETSQQQYTKRRTEIPLPLLRASLGSTSTTSPTSTTSTTILESGLNDLKITSHDSSLPLEEESITTNLLPITSIDYYQLAVESEQQGRLTDALTNYRKAFQLDPDADRSYHLLSMNRLTNEQTPLPNGDFRFNRTIQLAPDYNDKDHHRSEEMIEKAIGKASTSSAGVLGGERKEKGGVAQVENDHNHPSSTGFLLNSLLRSIASNPYVRPELTDHLAITDSTTSTTTTTTAESEIDQSEDVEQEAQPTITLIPIEPLSLDALSEVRDSIAFIPLDPSLPLHLGSLPREVLMLILKALLLSSVNPPPLPTRSALEIQPSSPPVPTRGRKKPRTMKEEMKAIEMELGLDLDEEVYKRQWKSDVEALERFAASCRAARIISLEDSLWRDLCLRTYVRPQLMSNESAIEIVRELHASDWRRCYIEHPRIRLDGVYISVVTYLRRGESQNAWYSAPHLITFYRYLRFYPTGLVISLQTVESPTTIVKKINPSLRMKGTTFGKWQLDHLDSSVELWDLEDPAILPKGIRKYSFRMGLKMSSTARGRMNKMEMRELKTVRKSDGEVEDVPLRPIKAFYFSKVASYALEESD